MPAPCAVCEGGIAVRTCWALYFAFLRLGAFTFGGGLAMLPLMEHEVVHKHGWTSEQELIDLYALAQCTPGIIAVNSAAYVGGRVAGVPGSLAAVLGQITSPMCLITCIAQLFQQLTDMPLFQHALAGISAMVCALLCRTVWTMGKKSVVDKLTALLCAVSLALSLFADAPLLPLTLGAGAIGVLSGRRPKK